MRSQDAVLVGLVLAAGAVSAPAAELPSLESSALILVDMQEGFLGEGRPLQVQGADALVDRLGDLVGSYRSRGLLVIHLRETQLPWWQKDTSANDLDPRLAPQEGEPVVDKEHADAFAGTNLRELLEARSIDTLVVAGVTTEACVRATACRAARNGFTVLIPRDGTASTTGDLHRTALDDIRTECARVTTIREIRDTLTPSSAASPH